MIDALELAGAFVLGFIIAGALGATLVKVLLDMHREDRKLGLAEAEFWRSERRELLNRILHPERMPVATTRPTANPEAAQRAAAARAEMASVGRVVQTNGSDMELP
jgi:hypothetical protein